MTVYADTPRWERHGMLWGHLVSDASLDELHAAADAAGLPPRSFDLDHYDWPDQARTALDGIGVVFVGNRDLARILRASGLRIPGARRPQARRDRTLAAARELGLERAPRDLIIGPRGHADPLPDEHGAFRMTREDAGAPPRIEAADAAGRAAALAFLADLDARAEAAGSAAWTGQVMDVAAAR